ncbi:unnamed protein product [Trichogramma brassicae]|uniref:Uncharacterized protein n=1 Tax=Trichogramma brassicae TaxID=86971 RepID=A0A6H5HSB7_9HYME|nr:unnamed protein product [Trichogramma brassicae]
MIFTNQNVTIRKKLQGIFYRCYRQYLRKKSSIEERTSKNMIQFRNPPKQHQHPKCDHTLVLDGRTLCSPRKNFF